MQCSGLDDPQANIMQRMHGILHETSLQAAQQRETGYSDSLAAGNKRTFSDATLETAGHETKASAPTHFKQATSLLDAPTRLWPSKIADFRPSVETSEYSQRKAFAATPSSSLDPELSLKHPVYGLPSELVANFSSLGINHIYPWQRSCLRGPNLLNGAKNLVYCAPTGGGKSLVADSEHIFALHCILVLLLIGACDSIDGQTRTRSAWCQSPSCSPICSTGPGKGSVVA